jgi:hypothetical protein
MIYIFQGLEFLILDLQRQDYNITKTFLLEQIEHIMKYTIWLTDTAFLVDYPSVMVSRYLKLQGIPVIFKKLWCDRL